jgi:tRNA (guanine-N7-)-methyltransferase
MPRERHPYGHAARLPEGTDPVDLRSLFGELGQGAPIEIEIGPGRGGFLFERAVAAPDACILGLEIRRKWAHIVNERLMKAGLAPRVQSLAEDAKIALPRLGPDAIVRAFFLHFPDPWWKKRHEKRLVMGDALLDQIARLLVPGGALYIQTDVEDRAALYESQVLAHSAFSPEGDDEGSARVEENPYGARSPREHRAISDGLPVHRLRFIKRREA